MFGSTLVRFRTPLQRAVIQRGYTVVIWRGRHVAERTELRNEEAMRYWLERIQVGAHA